MLHTHGVNALNNTTPGCPGVFFLDRCDLVLGNYILCLGFPELARLLL